MENVKFNINKDRLICAFKIFLESEAQGDIRWRKDNLSFFENIKKRANHITEKEISEIFTKKRLFSCRQFTRKGREGEIKKWLIDIINKVEQVRREGKNFAWDEIKKIAIDNRLPLTTEILCVFYPNDYWIFNPNKFKEMVNQLKTLGILKIEQKIDTKSYEQIGELEKEILSMLNDNQDVVNKYQSLIEREKLDFYIVDGFLFWLTKYKDKQEDLKQKIEECVKATTKPSESNEEVNKLEKVLETKLIKYFKENGYHFEESQISAFYSALKTKGFVILSGLSGTGKTKLAQLFAELLCPCDKCHKKNSQETEIKPDTECDTCTHIFLSVRPDWRDGKALLGYYNPITENYETTPFLKFILRAKNDYENNKENANPYFIILDEMNLSHVEYYFSDFLSVLESGRDENGWTKESIKLHPLENVKDLRGNEIPSEIKLPPNLYIIGTVNIDETTYMFSPKVLDRAFTLEFRDVDFKNYLSNGDNKNIKEIAKYICENILQDFKNNGKFCGAIADKTEVEEAIENLKNNGKLTELIKLTNLLQPYDLHFGYRVLNEIALFVKYATNAPDVVGKLDENTALDYAVLMKVLPKFHGPRQKLEKPFKEILKWAVSDQAPDWIKDPQKSILLDDIYNILKQWNLSESKHSKAETQQQNEPDLQVQSTEEQSSTSKDDRKEEVRMYFKYPNTVKKVLRMLRQLYETGFASFA